MSDKRAAGFSAITGPLVWGGVIYALEGTALEGSGDRGTASEEFARSAREIGKLRPEIPPGLRASFDNLPVVRDVMSRTRG